MIFLAFTSYKVSMYPCTIQRAIEIIVLVYNLYI
jgi:hypothetical protein